MAAFLRFTGYPIGIDEGIANVDADQISGETRDVFGASELGYLSFTTYLDGDDEGIAHVDAD